MHRIGLVGILLLLTGLQLAWTQSYDVTITHVGNGSVTPEGTQSVAHDEIVTIEATPDVGHHFFEWTVTGALDIANANSAKTQISNVSGTSIVSATFEINEYNVGVSSTGHGTVDPSGQQTVDHGDTMEIFAGPDAGYHFVNWTVSGGLNVLDVNSAYTKIADITGPGSVTAHFAINQYTVTVSSAGNGTVSPNTPQTVNYGGNLTISATPSAGYRFTTWTVTGSLTVADVNNANTQITNVTANGSVTANFAINQYTVTVSSAGNGTVSPNTPQTINHGDDLTISATPSSGYHFINWTVTGNLTVANVNDANTQITNVTADGSVTAHFSNTYVVSAVSAGNGTVLPNTPQNVVQGGNLNISAVAQEGYHFNNWTVIGGLTVANLNSANTQVTNVTGDGTVTAHFAINQYTVTVAASANGTVTPSTPQLVNNGGSLNITATPSSGYHFTEWTVSGGLTVADLNSANTQVTNVTGDGSVTAHFAINQYTVTVLSAGNGTVTPNGSQTVNYGGSVSLSATPETGYHFTNWTVSGGLTVTDVNSASTQVTNVTGDGSVTAHFAINQHTVTVVSAGNGAVTPNGAQIVNHGENLDIASTPAAGYHFTNWTVSSGLTVANADSAGTQVTNVTGDGTVTAHFALNQYTVTVSSSGLGTVIPSGPQTVNHGANLNISAVPLTGYHFVRWTPTGGLTVENASSANTRVLNVTGDGSVTAQFDINVYTVTLVSAGNGVVIPSGAQTVNHGSTLDITADPDVGYHFSRWTVSAGLTVTGINSATTQITNITTNGTVTAQFVSNAMPVVSNIPNQSIVSGQNFTSIQLDNYVVDGDTPDDKISWTATGQSNVAVTITTRIAAMTYNAVWSGLDTITFTARDPEGNADSDDVIFRVYPPLTINTQPVSQTRYTGQSVQFSVTAGGGTGIYNYRWQKNGVTISGAISSILIRNNLQLSDSGYYRCFVTSGGVSVVSAVATLSVYLTVSITRNPSDSTVWPGQSASFSVSAVGKEPINYQWQKNNANIPGASNSAMLSIASVTPNHEGAYRCIATNGGGSDTSSAATLTVNGPVVITQQPVDDSAFTGKTASFSITASGTPTITYQWQKDQISIPGATARQYNIDTVKLASAGKYRCIVKNGGGEATSVEARLYVLQTVYITDQPDSLTINLGENASFTVVAAGQEPISYQWLKNGAAILNADSPVFTITSAQFSNAGLYRCQVTNGGGSVSSNNALLSINGPATIIQHPSDTVGWTGRNVSFSITAAGTKPITYQWQKNGSDLAADTGYTLILSAISVNDSGNYRCIAANKAGTDTSNYAALIVKQTVVINQQPDSQSVFEGDNAGFSISAIGADPITYQWQKNGFAIIGQTSPALKIERVTSADAGNYRCIAVNGGGSDTSDIASLKVSGAGIRIVSPNGGELWTIGSKQDITWTTAGLVDSVSIEVSTTGGSSWQILAGNIINTGTYAWTVPTILTEFCKVRVSHSGDGFPADESDSLFTINKIVAILDVQDNTGKSLGNNFSVVPNPVDIQSIVPIRFVFSPAERIVSATVRIYDPVGNVVGEFVTTDISRAIPGKPIILGTWNLRNKSKRVVGGGSYVAIAVLTGANGERNVRKAVIGIKGNR